MARRLLDLLFGFDFFISYAWRDGGGYAEGLAQRLRSLGYEVFLDRAGFSAGDDWKSVGDWTLRRTSQLVLVATPAALMSEPVEREVRVFTKTGRRVIPIDIGGALEHTPDAAVTRFIRQDILRIREAASSLASGPSSEAIATIHRSFNLVRQDKKRLRAFMAIAAVLAVLAVAAAVGAIKATQSAALAALRRDDALRSQTLFLANEASKKVGSGDAGSALWLAVDALPKGDPLCPIDRPYMPEAELALNQVIQSLRETLVLQHPSTPHSDAGMVEPGTTAHVYHAEFDPSGSTIVTAADDGALRLWNVKDGKPSELHTVNPNAFFFDVHYNREGTKLAAGSTDGTLWVWDLRDRNHPRAQFARAHDDSIQHVAFSPDGRIVATASSDKKVLIWDADDVAKGPTCALTEQQDAVYRVAFDEAGARVATAPRDGIPRVLNLESCTSFPLKGHGDGAVFEVQP
jgi:hypothetical protein